MKRTIRSKRPRRKAVISPAKKTKAPVTVGPSDSASSGLSSILYSVSVRFRQDGKISEIALPTTDRSFYPMVQHWRYVIANRQRITDATRGSLTDDIFQWLCRATKRDVPNLTHAVKAMARSGLIEVRIPFESERMGWAARVFPWEDVIGLLTRPYRVQGAPFSVIRHLACTQTRAADQKPATQMIVRSGPGEIGRTYELEPECLAVADMLGLKGYRGRDGILREPDRESLRQKVAGFKPDVIHLTGVDPLALQSLGIEEVGENQDGFVLASKAGSLTPYDSIRPEALAQLLNPKDHTPWLVSFASCFSAQRLAALTCGLGAHHSIGFQDTVSDADALVFYSTFYRVWKEQRWDILAAFARARVEYRKQSAMSAAGVVLWSRKSLLDAAVPPDLAAKPVRRMTLREPGEDDFRVTIKPSPRLNYSLLHNHRSPFDRLLVQKRLAGRLPPLEVEVRLEVGGDSCRWKTAQALPDEINDLVLTKDVSLPLVAGLLRQCSEAMRSNLHTRLTCGSLLIYENSESVTLSPADEWRDDGVDHLWLPSFVQPRDPGVLKVILLAQRYLKTLTDDCTAAFDGYQQVVAGDASSLAVVDLQVQAIWAALQHDLKLEYINPPPSYTSLSQRLRTPSQILEGCAATCIDLALLFASCLEYVGIYPVLFLIEGHAFPGYWRSEAAWWEMRQFQSTSRIVPPSDATAPSPSAPGNLTVGQSELWLFAGSDNLAELLGYVGEGTLAAFEGTYVTSRRSFYSAQEEGPANLRPETFDAMVDIQLARERDVTPLPLSNPNVPRL